MKRKKEQQNQEESSLTTPPTEEIFTALVKYLQKAEETNNETRYFIDTGNLGLNYIISGNLCGGYSSGLVTELFGDPSTGKTLLMMVAAAKMQEAGGLVIVADVERRWDWGFAKVHKVDQSKVLVHSPETVEQWSIETDEILNSIIKQDPVPKSLFILDSIASLSTYWEMEAIGVKEDQGKKAKRLKAAMRVIPKKLSKAGAILLASNHIIENPQIQYGPKGYAPGGKGFPFQSSIRLELFKPIQITPEGKNRPIGATLRLKCAKNSICPPFGEVSMNVTWSGGLQRYSGLVDMMVDLDILQASLSGWYSYNGGRKFRAGEIEKFVTEEDPAILEDAKWKLPYFLS
jgi:recombination protein RecA